MKDGGHSVGRQTSAARRCRACSAARTVARWNMQVTDAEVQHSKNSFNSLRRAHGCRAPADCPHIGAGAGRLSACSVRLPFAGEIGAMRVMLGSLERFASRRAQAWPSGSKLGRLERPGAYACGRRANHSIVGLQRLRPSRGTANRRERLDGCPFNSFLRRTNVLERAPLQQRTNKYEFAGRLASMLYRQRCEPAGQLYAM